MIRDLLVNRQEYNKIFLQRPTSVSSFLPYDEYLEDTGVFVQKDGSLGAIFKVELIEHEVLNESEIVRIISATKSLFCLPTSYVVQFLYDSSYYSKHDPFLSNLMNNYPDGNKISEKLFNEKILDIKDKFSPLKRELFVSIRHFPKVKNRANFKGLRNSSDIINKELGVFKTNLAIFVHFVKLIKSIYGFKLFQLTDKDLCNTLRRFFNPVTFYKREFCPLNKHISLSEQLIYTTSKMNFDGIEREGVKTKTITLKTAPMYSFPGGMAYFVNLDFPIRLSLNVSFPADSKVKKFLSAKEFFLENAASSKARIQRQEIRDLDDALARDDRCLSLTFCVIIEGETDEDLAEKARKVRQIFNDRLECETIDEEDIGLGLCFNSLPLNYTPDADLSTRRAIKVLRSDILNFLPIFDSFRGTKRPLSVYLSREKNIVPFSLLENETSNHTVVLADTGSGKSAFVIDCIQSAKRLSPEPIVFVIDKKSSYGMLSHYFNGNLTVFDRNEIIPFSPFRGEYNDEKISFLTKIITMAVALTSPSFIMESDHKEVISKALRLAYLKKCERNGLDFLDGELVKKDTDNPIALSMEDVVIELGTMPERDLVLPIITKLKPFYSDGIYSKFFTEGNHLNDKQKGRSLFYIYDLDALDSDPTLQTLMTMAVIEEIRCTLALEENRGRVGFLIMEEFAMLGRNNPAFRDFAIDFAETMRKRGCWLITLTPRPQNYFDLEVGKAFWGVADNFIFLQMNPDNVEYIAEKSSLFDEASIEILKSLRTKKGQYADVFYMNKSKTIQGSFRFRQTKYDRWLSPTNAADALAAIKAINMFEDKWQALEYLINEEAKC